jgi:hypothetical protein
VLFTAVLLLRRISGITVMLCGGWEEVNAVYLEEGIRKTLIRK